MINIIASQIAKSTPFDNSGINYNAAEVQSALVEIRDHSVYNSETQATTLNGTNTLNAANKTVQFYTGSATGYNVQMPSATTLFVCANYFLINQSSQTFQVKDGSGANLFVLGQSSVGFLMLQLNGTAAGTWVYWQTTVSTASGIVSYNVISGTGFGTSAAIDTLITGMTVTPQAGTYAIWFNAQNTAAGAGAQLDSTVYKGGSAVPDSKRSVLSTTGTHIFQESTQTIVQFDGSQSCAVYVNANGNTMTVGARSLLLIRLGT